MKKVIRNLAMILLVITISIVGKKGCYAAEVQYTDNVIPVMTSNSSPSGVAKASGVYLDYEPWKAFDHDTSTQPNGWQITPAKGSYLEYDFTKAKCITKYSIVSFIFDQARDQYVSELPKTWTFEAYDENLAKWVTLDTRKNITDWSYKVKKEFIFSNTTSYEKYRINIAENCGQVNYTAIGELEMMETVSETTNLTATLENSNVKLNWDIVHGATSYIIKRSATSGGPYNQIATASGSAITYTDKDVKNGTTYYYVVTTVNAGGESGNSNEASATPKSDSVYTGNKAILEVAMTNGMIKEYDLTMDEIDKFLTWYDNRSDGTGKSYYRIIKRSNVKPFNSRYEYLQFDKIYSFEVKDYNDK